MSRRDTWVAIGLEYTRIPRLVFLCSVLVLLLFVCITQSGCALRPWCDEHPRACPVVVAAGALCVGVAAGFISQQVHKSAINPAPTVTPFVSAFEAADQSRKFLNIWLHEGAKL